MKADETESNWGSKQLEQKGERSKVGRRRGRVALQTGGQSLNCELDTVPNHSIIGNRWSIRYRLELN